MDRSAILKELKNPKPGKEDFLYFLQHKEAASIPSKDDFLFFLKEAKAIEEFVPSRSDFLLFLKEAAPPIPPSGPSGPKTLAPDFIDVASTVSPKRFGAKTLVKGGIMTAITYAALKFAQSRYRAHWKGQKDENTTPSIISGPGKLQEKTMGGTESDARKAIYNAMRKKSKKEAYEKIMSEYAPTGNSSGTYYTPSGGLVGRGGIKRRINRESRSGLDTMKRRAGWPQSENLKGEALQELWAKWMSKDKHMPGAKYKVRPPRSARQRQMDNAFQQFAKGTGAQLDMPSTWLNPLTSRLGVGKWSGMSYPDRAREFMKRYKGGHIPGIS